MFIRTERLFLRPAWAEDAHELTVAIAHECVVRNLARVPWPYAVDDACQFIAGSQDWRYPELLITSPDAGGSRLIGGVGLHAGEHGAELGYWLTPDIWGHGLAVEAAGAILRLAALLGHRHVSAHHFLDNPASGRVLEKLGFACTGHISERYSAARGGSALSREYRLPRHGDASGDRGASGCGDHDMGKRAA